jgi:hypothetical protein
MIAKATKEVDDFSTGDRSIRPLDSGCFLLDGVNNRTSPDIERGN